MTRSRKLKGVTIIELTSQTNGQGGGQDGVSNIEEDGEASLAGENFQIGNNVLNSFPFVLHLSALLKLILYLFLLVFYM